MWWWQPFHVRFTFITVGRDLLRLSYVISPKLPEQNIVTGEQGKMKRTREAAYMEARKGLDEAWWLDLVADKYGRNIWV